MTHPCRNRERGRATFRASLFLLPLLLCLLVAPAAATVHKVRKGDSLSRIAKRYHVPVREIREANSLASDDLSPGTRLVIPPSAGKGKGKGKAKGASVPDRASDEGGTDPAVPLAGAAPPGSPLAKLTAGGIPVDASAPAAPVRHRVKKGDTFSSIAREHRISVRELRALNGLRKASRLRPGSVLLVSRGGGKHRRGPDPEALDRHLRTVASASDAGEPEGTFPLREGVMEDGARCATPPGGEAISAAPSVPAEPPAATVEGTGTGAAPSEGWGFTGKVLALAKSMLDVPYRFGGSSFRGIDCSAYVQKVFGYLNIPLPRSARQQFERGERIEKEQLAKGDLVFFQTYARFPSHVGIYLGDNQFIHASSRDRKVRIDSLDAPYYVKRYIGARRMLDPLGNALQAEVGLAPEGSSGEGRDEDGLSREESGP